MFRVYGFSLSVEPVAYSYCHDLTYLQAYSRDGTNFAFVDRAPWLRPGLAGSSSSQQLWLAQPGPVRIGDEELYFVSRANTKECKYTQQTILLSIERRNGLSQSMSQSINVSIKKDF